MKSDKFAFKFNEDFAARFFSEAAFLRLSTSETLVWLGPFKREKQSLNAGTDLEFDLGFLSFFGSESECLSKGSREIVANSSLTALCDSVLADQLPTMQRTNFLEPSPEAFAQSLQTIKGKIQREEIEKAVAISFSRSELSPKAADLAHWLKNILQAPHNLWSYGYWNENEGIMGASPEILFRQQEGRIQSMALAGTCPKDDRSGRLELHKDPKELAEHQIVVKDLEGRLGQLGWVRKGETEIFELPQLLHLVTHFLVEAGRKPTLELVKLLHPTPAMGVSPRAYGYHWLRELPEQKDRNLFGAPLFFRIGPADVLCLAAIRNIQWGKRGSQVGSGAGIVAASEQTREWNELAAKRDSVFKSLGL